MSFLVTSSSLAHTGSYHAHRVSPRLRQPAASNRLANSSALSTSVCSTPSPPTSLVCVSLPLLSTSDLSCAHTPAGHLSMLWIGGPFHALLALRPSALPNLLRPPHLLSMPRCGSCLSRRCASRLLGLPRSPPPLTHREETGRGQEKERGENVVVNEVRNLLWRKLYTEEVDFY